jgi:hypothetical protein
LFQIGVVLYDRVTFTYPVFIAMKKLIPLLIICCCLGSYQAGAQCSICTRTTQQLGERPGKAFNAGIIYLAFTPLAIGGILGYRWWKQNRSY